MNRAPLERRNSVPVGVSALDPDKALALIQSERCVIIDVRTFTQFAESRVKGAVNVCIPSTLLKRISFNFQRMREFVPASSARKLKLVDSRQAIVLYDQKTTALESCGQNSLLWTISKLRQHLNDFNVDAMLGFVIGGFSALDSQVIDDTPLPEDAEPVNPLPPVVTQNVHPAPSSSSYNLNENLLQYMDQFPVWIRALFTAQAQSKNIVTKNWTLLQTAESARVHHALGEQKLVAGTDISKNRYSNIAPYQHTRVLLKRTPDYINASHIQASYSNLRYIATQAPLPATFGDFWELIWDQNVPIIVMLTTLTSETGQIKGDNYWLPGTYGTIELISVDQTHNTSGIAVRTITLLRNGKKRTITQIHYESWPDVACPSSMDDVFTLIRLKSELLKDPELPVVVHCSAGCGRTGTFCTVDTIVTHLASRNDLSESQDLVNSTVAEFRSQRLAMVQVQRQFLFCYDTVILWYYRHYIMPRNT